MIRLRPTALLLLLTASCTLQEAAPAGGGTIVIATAADAKVLLPPLVSDLQGRVVSDLLFDRLAEVGPGLNTVGDSGFLPRLAQRWSWAPDSMSVAFELHPDARWHDGQPVTAADVRFAFDLIRDPALASPSSTELEVIDSVSTSGARTAVVWFKRRAPERFYAAAFNLVPLPAHRLSGIAPGALAADSGSRRPVGSGPFRLVRWMANQRIELAAVDAHYRGRPPVDRVVWSIAKDPATNVRRLFAGEVDFWEQLTPADVAEAARFPGVRTTSYGGFDYYFLQFNTRDGDRRDRPHPLFGDRQLRRALTMAVDRQAITRAILDSLGSPALGPFVRAQYSADTTLAQLPTDRARATALLDSLGWRDADGDGLRERRGRPLRFTMLVPASSKNRQRAAVLLQEQFRQVGVQAEIESADFPSVMARQQARRFDAVLSGIHPSPSPSGTRQSWGSAGLDVGGQNYGRYENTAFDAAIDSALAAQSPGAARAWWRRAYAIIIEDAPAIWLYEPRPTAGVHRRVFTGALRADAWWLGIERWSIAPDERLPRDRRAADPARP